MRRTIAIIGVCAQLAVLAFMAGDREWLIYSGQTVYLRTRPIDPRDPFRGDYVRLDYEISTLNSRLWRDGLKTAPATNVPAHRQEKKPGQRVFVGLSVDEAGVASAEYVTDRRPAAGLFLKGRTEQSWGEGLLVRYGLEAYFMQQGKALELEKGRARPDGIRIPLEMETAVRANGASVLKGYRWCPMGIGLEVQSDRSERTSMGQRPRQISAKLTLYNASDMPIAIVDLPAAGSFTLESDEWRGLPAEEWQWVGRDAARPAAEVRDEDVKVLPPGGTHVLTILFKDEAWFVRKAGGPAQSLSDTNTGWAARFRFVYRPPSKESCARLKNAGLIWHGHLLSSAFSGGIVD